MQNQRRQLAAILFTDIVGYTAMMEKDEQSAVIIARRYVAVLKQTVSLHGGEIVNDYGDGSLSTFSSATEAVRCAIELQRRFQVDPKVPLRIGLHIGEIFFEDGKVFGDGVNIASRIQSLGIANSILFSSEINSKLKNQQEFKNVSIGLFHFKNVEHPMEVFALANEGLVVPKREQMEGKLRKKNSLKRNLIVAAAFLVLVVAAFFLYRNFSNKPGFSSHEKSIAILPFKIIGNNEDALGDGLVDDILAHLMKIKDLKVISNRSSAQYGDTKKSLQEIGNILSVNSLLTGTVQQIENKIRVTAQLIDSRSGDMIWTEVYNRDKIQIFELQTELATQIANALKANLTSEEKKELSMQSTENVEAYKLYRKGLYFWNKRTSDSYDSAEVYYKKAIELDPEYALAYSGLADCYPLNGRGMPPAKSIPIARAYLTKALSLDSSLAEAWTTIGFIKSHFEYDWDGGKSILEKAIRLNPNYPTAHLYYGNIFLFNGDTKQGIKEIKKALELDPLSVSINWSLSNRYYFAREYDQSIDQANRTLTFAPDFVPAKAQIAFCFLQKKQFAQAIDIFNKLPASEPARDLWLCTSYALEGDKTKARAILDKCLSGNNRPPSYLLAYAYIALGDLNDALTELEKEYEERSIFLIAAKIVPEFDPLRNEPRFKAILKKMNLNN